MAALQMYLAKDQDASLRKLATEIKDLPGVKCPIAHGGQPHMTLGTWLVDDAGLQDIKDRLPMACANIRIMELAVQAKSHPDGKQVWIGFSPKNSPAMLEMHKSLHQNLNLSHEPWRKMDLPGSWSPHITLCMVDGDKKDTIDLLVKKISHINSLRFESIGLMYYNRKTKNPAAVCILKP